LGEKEWLTPERLLEQESAGEIAAFYEKLDGSMIASAYFEGQLHWRSKKAFHSDVVKLTQDYLKQKINTHLAEFSEKLAQEGYTVIFELTHPDARIVVEQKEPLLQLLHIRHNHTGEYVMLNAEHPVHGWINEYRVPTVRRFEGQKLRDIFQSLENMTGQEGYVIQLRNGDMVKLKCPWYSRLHRSITFLRERDIASLALNEELDDIKAALKEAGIDLQQVHAVESKLKSKLLDIEDEIESVYHADKHLERKDFAIKYKNHALFSLIIQRYAGKEMSIKEWYARNRLRVDFSLRVLANGALAEAMEG
jgi:RNA ligase